MAKLDNKMRAAFKRYLKALGPELSEWTKEEKTNYKNDRDYMNQRIKDLENVISCQFKRLEQVREDLYIHIYKQINL